MSKNILKMAAIGLGIVALIVAVILFATRGAHIRLEGTVQRVRVQPMPDNSCVVIVDFRFRNPADYPFIVRDARLLIEDADGNVTEGMAVAAVDAERMFEYYSRANPDLGPMYNAMLVARDRIEPKEMLDRMLVARFELSEEAIRNRRRVILRIEDVDGAVTEIAEEPRNG